MNLETVLDSILSRPNIKILELGISHLFTRRLNALANANRKASVTTIDLGSNLANTGIVATKNHAIIFLDGWMPFLKTYSVKSFDIVIVCMNSWDLRKEFIFKNIHEIPIMIVPDCDYFSKTHQFGRTIAEENHETHTPGKFDYSDVFKFYKVVYPSEPWPLKTGPPILIGSMTNSLELESEKEQERYTRITITTASQIADLFGGVKEETMRVATA